MVGLKKKKKKKWLSHTQQSQPKVLNPRDIAENVEEDKGSDPPSPPPYPHPQRPTPFPCGPLPIAARQVWPKPDKSCSQYLRLFSLPDLICRIMYHFTRGYDQNHFFNSFRKTSVMIGSILFVLGSCERHSKFTEEMYIPLRPDTKGRPSVIDVSVNWLSNRNWQTEVLDSWKVTQLNSLRQRRVK